MNIKCICTAQCPHIVHDLQLLAAIISSVNEMIDKCKSPFGSFLPEEQGLIGSLSVENRTKGYASLGPQQSTLLVFCPCPKNVLKTKIGEQACRD